MLAAPLRHHKRHRSDFGDVHYDAPRVASWRLVIPVVFSALLMSLYLLFPTAFPHPHGRPPYLGLVMLAIPILLAAIQWCRAARAHGFTQGR